jgi:hypothetical protein
MFAELRFKSSLISTIDPLVEVVPIRNDFHLAVLHDIQTRVVLDQLHIIGSD